MTTVHHATKAEHDAYRALKATWARKERRCLCPSDCGCWPYSYRANVCGCKAHE